MAASLSGGVEQRARLHGALADPHRLAIVEALALSDRSPGELGRALELPSNLLSHHVDVLEREGLVERLRSSADRRRRYLRLRRERFDQLLPWKPFAPSHAVLFVCSHNSARSQLAVALWRERSSVGAESAGTHPAERVHPLAVRVARRAGLDLRGAKPRRVDEIEHEPDLVVTVCDEANEELRTPLGVRRLHWSLADPVATGDAGAFEQTLDALRERVESLSAAIGSETAA